MIWRCLSGLIGSVVCYFGIANAQPVMVNEHSLSETAVVRNFSGLDERRIREILEFIESKCSKSRDLELLISFNPEERPRESLTTETIAEVFPNIQLAIQDVLNLSRDELFSKTWDQSVLGRVIGTRLTKKDKKELRIEYMDQLLQVITRPWYESDGSDVVHFFSVNIDAPKKSYSVEASLRGQLIHEVIGHLLVEEFPEQARRTLYHEFEAANNEYLSGRSPESVPDSCYLDNWVSLYAKNGNYVGRDIAELLNKLINEIATVKESMTAEELERFENLEIYVRYFSRVSSLKEDVAETITYVLLDRPYIIGHTAERKVRAVNDFLELIARESD